MQQLAGSLLHAGDRLNHVHRDADRSGLVSDRARNGLPDPPCCVGRELKALRIIKLIDRLQQTHVAFLDQVKELHPASDILLCDADDQSEIRLGQTVLRRLIVRVIRKPSCEFCLLLGCQERHSADLLQIDLDRVVRGSAALKGHGILLRKTGLNIVIEQFLICELQIQHVALLVELADLLIIEFHFGKCGIQFVLRELSAELDALQKLLNLLIICCHRIVSSLYLPFFFLMLP